MVHRKIDWNFFLIIISEQLGLDIAGAEIIPWYCSNHSLICIAFKTDIVKRNRPFWKFNNSLLPDTVFVNLTKQVILDLKRRYAIPVCNWENIHLIEDEQLVFTLDDQLFF